MSCICRFVWYGLRGRRNAILANACDDELQFAEDGTFELVLSVEQPPSTVNWLRSIAMPTRW